MSSLFKSILIPIDFSGNTEVAVNQSIELACTSGSTLHLLHVVRPKTFWGVIAAVNQSRSQSMENDRVSKARSKLYEVKSAIERSVSHCQVITYVTEGAVCRNIQAATKQINPGLIVIGKNNNHKYFSLHDSVCPNDIAKSTGYPVLTVMKNKSDAGIKIIVVPVGSFIPKRKIELVTELAKKHRAAIHLVTIPNEIDFKETEGNSFLETYRILKTGLTSPVEHHILKGSNLPKAILEYAECIRADLILVNPGSETKISNLTGKHINDVIPISSKLKVLSIEPYPGNHLSVG